MATAHIASSETWQREHLAEGAGAGAAGTVATGDDDGGEP
jgi:hypothetical protein